MDCPKCNRPNRAKAKYCKWCGARLEISTGFEPSIDNLIGKDDIAKHLREVVDTAIAVDRQGRRRGTTMRARLSFAITGPSGSGKTFVARAITHELYKAGIVAKDTPREVKSIEYDAFVNPDNFSKNIKDIKGNVLIIDEAQKHCPGERADSVTDIDRILQHCDDWCDDPDCPIVIFVGDENLAAFFENNPTARAIIQEHISVPEPSIEDLAHICAAELGKLKYTAPPETVEKIQRVLIATKRRDPAKFNLGHEAARMAYEVYSDPNATGSVATPEMIKGEEFVPKTLPEIMAEFDKYVGIDEIKNEINKIAASVEEARSKGKKPSEALKSHFVFVGNPGTGKTTMARLFAEALGAMGALPQGHLVEVDPEKLISQYIGESPKLIRQYVAQAMGGVLFIDEAYGLWKGPDDKEGTQAINTLLKDCEDKRGQFVCILAGYPIEMNRFMDANTGLERRFDKKINFRDYTGPELTQIFINMATKGKEPLTLADDLKAGIGPFFDKMYLTRGRRFGNAGTVRDTLQKARERMQARIVDARANGTLDPAAENTMIMSDLEEQKKQTVDDILATLDDMVGMDSVKEQIRDIAKSVKMRRKMIEMGIGNASVDNIHIVLTGNPGTGKTTVAKRLGQVFKAIGVIPTDKVIVKEAKDIFDSYAKSAGQNMTRAVDDAMGGILFLDEAYALLPMNAPGQADQAGTEAINALMTCMSERQGQFITIIAGYKNEIDEFIRNANPGLSRRFTTRIHIPDYSAADLTTIFLQQVKKAKMKITPDAEELLRRKIDEMVTAKDEKFGNAGTIINLFNETQQRHFKNLSDEDSDDPEKLITIVRGDIPYDAPRRLDMDEIMGQLDHLVGLKGVKDSVRDLADSLMTMQARMADSDTKEPISLSHYLFLGNPGTGKTTVARIMGDIFYSLGLLPSNKVIELSAKDLKAPYVGQTAPKAHAAMMQGMGGVVFIDEAYSITQGEGETGFGREAVSEILQVMENYKNKFITIAAGYPDEMAEWLDSNSGLASRFNETIMFEDYSADELTRIACNILSKRNLQIGDAARSAMLLYFQRLVAHKSRNFANAREARNFADKVLINQGRRLRQEMKLPGFDKESFYILEPADMLVD